MRGSEGVGGERRGGDIGKGGGKIDWMDFRGPQKRYFMPNYDSERVH